VKATVYGHTGVVGAQLYRWLNKKKIPCVGVSLDSKHGDPIGASWVFICLPTPTREHHQDITAIADLLFQLPEQPLNLVIRSTVLPGTCRYIQEMHTAWNVYHWPEFLSARTAWHDFIVPKVAVVGVSSETACHLWKSTWEQVLPEPKNGICFTDLDTAETIKYAHNVHGALQVIYSNLVWDVCHIAEGNYKAVTKIMPLLGYLSPELVNAYWQVGKDGYRGFDGACFPKDVAALAGFLGVKAELLVGMESANKRLRAEKI